MQFPDAERIVLVLDELNTDSPASFYAVFPPAEAKRLADRLEIHWQRFDGRTALAAAASDWAARRNISTTALNWRFTTADARTKLKRLYPVLQPRRTTRL